MKRMLTLCCVVALLLVALVVPAAAAAYTDTVTFEFTRDYTYTYGGSVGVVKFDFVRQIPSFIITQEYVPTGGTGWVFSFITYNRGDAQGENEAYSAQDTTISNNVLEATASLSGFLYPTKTNHFASRTYNGTSNSWDYYYVSSYHGVPRN